MSTHTGRKGRITVNSDTTEAIVAEMGAWSITMTTAEVDTGAFGDGWSKSDVGLKSWSATMEGNYDPDDTTGQDVIETAYLNGTLLSDIRFYTSYSSTSGQTLRFHEPDLASDANAGMRVTNLQIGQTKNGVGTISISLSGSGPIIQTTSTVP